MSEVLGLAKLAGVDDLEFVRGAIAAFSCKPDLSAREVHVGRLSRLQGHAGLPSDLDSALETLDQLREIQRLDGGYLLPTPIRRIEFTESHSMLIAVHPTKELHRHFSTVKRIGAARVVATSTTATLPEQPLAAWLGVDGRTAGTWTQIQMLDAKGKLSPSVYEDSLQGFGLTRAPGNHNCGVPTWVSLTSTSLASWRGVSLFRSPIAAKRYRYFLGRADSKKAILEGPTIQQHLRLRFGLATLLGMRMPIDLARREARTVLKFPLLPPPPERRLLLALCTPEGRGSGYEWSCPTDDILPIVKDGLLNLECEFIEHG